MSNSSSSDARSSSSSSEDEVSVKGVSNDASSSDSGAGDSPPGINQQSAAQLWIKLKLSLSASAVISLKDLTFRGLNATSNASIDLWIRSHSDDFSYNDVSALTLFGRYMDISDVIFTKESRLLTRSIKTALVEHELNKVPPKVSLAPLSIKPPGKFTSYDNWYEFKDIVHQYYTKLGLLNALTKKMNCTQRRQIGASLCDLFDGELSAVKASHISAKGTSKDGDVVETVSYYLMENASKLMETPQKDERLHEVFVEKFSDMQNSLSAKSDKETERFILKFSLLARDAMAMRHTPYSEG